MGGFDIQMARRLDRGANGAALVAAAIGAAALFGWALHIQSLESLYPGLATMKIDTALALLLGGSALLIKVRSIQGGYWDRAAELLAVAIALLALLNLLEWVFHANFGIDQLFGRDLQTPLADHPGRMSSATAACLLADALAIALLDRATRASQVAAVAALLFSLLALLGYTYGIQSLYRITPYSSMALHTAVGIWLLSVAQLMSRPRRCIHLMLVSDSVGGALVRRLLPLVVLIPLVVGWLALKGQQRGLYEMPFGMALFAISTIIILASLVWWNASLLDATDKNRRRIAADHDLLLIREQDARQRSERALLARDQLLAVVSHELRTPLTPALLVLSSLEHRQDLPAEVVEDLKMVADQIRLEATLVGDLLDLVGLEQAKITLVRQPTRANEFVEKTVAMFASAFASKRIGLTLQLTAQQPWISADNRRLQQVLRNLLDNAAKFTPEGGHVIVRSFDGSDRRFCLEVSDTGVGIAPEVLARLFNAFSQGESTLNRRFGGLGIGLRISRMLVELHGGTLTARSPGIDQGATFRLELPGAAAPAVAIPTSASPRAARRSILLVEDNTDTLLAMSRLLRSHGYHVTPAASAQKAIDAAGSTSFDVVISDIGLPDMDGWDLMRTLRQKSNIRGIALSGFTTDADRQKSLDSGFGAHLAKPVELAQLIEVIEVTLQPNAA